MSGGATQTINGINLSGTGIVMSNAGVISYINGTNNEFVLADGSIESTLNYWKLGGNATVSLSKIGTSTNFDFSLIRNGISVATIGTNLLTVDNVVLIKDATYRGTLAFGNNDVKIGNVGLPSQQSIRFQIWNGLSYNDNLYFNASGQMGINTINPSAIIHAISKDSSASNYSLKLINSLNVNLMTLTNDGKLGINAGGLPGANLDLYGSTTVGETVFSLKDGYGTNFISGKVGGFIQISQVYGPNVNIGPAPTAPIAQLELQRDATQSNQYIGFTNLQPGFNYRYFLGINATTNSFRLYDSTAGADRFVLTKDGNFGFLTPTPNSTIHLNGSLAVAFVKSNTGAVTANGHTDIICNNAATAITVTLPNAVTVPGRVYRVYRTTTSTGVVTINTAGGTVEALNGTAGATTTLAALGALGAKVMFISDGTNWLRRQNS